MKEMTPDQKEEALEIASYLEFCQGNTRDEANRLALQIMRERGRYDG